MASEYNLIFTYICTYKNITYYFSSPTEYNKHVRLSQYVRINMKILVTHCIDNTCMNNLLFFTS